MCVYSEHLLKPSLQCFTVNPGFSDIMRQITSCVMKLNMLCVNVKILFPTLNVNLHIFYNDSVKLYACAHMLIRRGFPHFSPLSLAFFEPLQPHEMNNLIDLYALLIAVLIC